MSHDKNKLFVESFTTFMYTSGVNPNAIKCNNFNKKVKNKMECRYEQVPLVKGLKIIEMVFLSLGKPSPS